MPTRRQLRFETIGEAVRDAEHLLAAGYDKAGRWDLAQACSHLALWASYPLDGFPPIPFWLKPVFFVVKRTTLPKMTRQVLDDRTLPAGLSTAPQTVFPPGQDAADAVQKLTTQLRRYETPLGKTHESPLFGFQTDANWLAMVLTHTAHHLSFLVPKHA